MKMLAENMEYEQAALLRNKIFSIKQISERQKIVSDSGSNQDVCAFVCYDDIAFFEVFFVRNGRINGRSSYRVEKIGELSDIEIMTAFIKQFYTAAAYIPETSTSSRPRSRTRRRP
jgi:excinuclease ABC subunit C